MALEQPPRSPVQNIKSGTWDAPDNYDRALDSFFDASREEARRTHRISQEAGRIQTYISSLLGDGYWRGNARAWRSRFVDNRLAKCRLDHLAQLTDIRPVIDVSTSVDAYKPDAAVIAAIVRETWERNAWDQVLVNTADIADCYGTGFTRFGAAWPGEQNALACGPDQVLPIQPGKKLQESSAVLYQTWKSVWWVKQKFPFSSNGIEREILNQPLYGTSGDMNQVTFNRPTNIDEFTWNGLSQGMKRLLGMRGAPTQDPTIGQYYKTLQLEELFVDDPTQNDSINNVIVADPFLPLNAHNWWYEVKPGQRLFPRKRHIVRAGSRTLSDGPSPFWHGLYPFAMLQFNPVFWSFWGLSKYRDLLPLNVAMNEIVAGTIDLVRRALNPVAMTKEGAVSAAAWAQFYPDLPGTKLRVGQNVSLADALRYMPPPEVPAYVFQVLQWIATEFDRQSGSIDVAAMGRKKQNPGSDSIESMKAAQNTNLRLEERQLELYIRDSGTQVLSNTIQFSSADYRLKLLGEAGLTAADFNGELGTMLPEDRAAQPAYWKSFAMKTTAGSQNSDAKNQEKSVAINLASKRLLPIQKMYETIGVPSPAATFKMLVEEEKATADATGKKSSGPKSGKRDS